MGRLRSVVVAIFLTGLAARADEVLTRDGRRIPAVVAFVDGQLRVSTGTPPRPVARDEVVAVLFAPVPSAPFRAGVTHEVGLVGGGRLGGELLALNERELLLRTPWSDRVAVPRAAVARVSLPPRESVVLDEDFEDGPSTLRLAGEPGTTEARRTSGRRALRLERPGQSATWEAATPIAAGRVAVNVDLPEKAGGATVALEVEFDGPKTIPLVRVVVAGPGDAFAVEAPTPKDEGVVEPRGSGWRRLTIAFAPTSLLVTADDRVLWFRRAAGPGGPLRRVRLVSSGAGTADVAFDELTAIRTLEERRHPLLTPRRDELWTADGDQLFGTLGATDRRGFTWDKRRATWAEARGVFPARAARAPQMLTGEIVRLSLTSVNGNEPDELEGVLTALDATKLTLRHASLGDVDLPRGVVRRLRPLFHGRRVELAPGLLQLGEAKGVTFPIRGDGFAATVRLTATLWEATGAARADLFLNGEKVGTLGGAGRFAAVPRPERLPLGALRAGNNALELRPVGGAVVLSDVAVETEK